MATEGPSGESPRGRHPKGEAHRVEVSGGKRLAGTRTWGGRRPDRRRTDGLPEVGTGEVQDLRVALGAANLGEAQGGLHLLVEGSFRELVASDKSDPRPSLPQTSGCGLRSFRLTWLGRPFCANRSSRNTWPHERFWALLSLTLKLVPEFGVFLKGEGSG